MAALRAAVAGADALLHEAAAVEFASNAYAHCKVIGHTPAAAKLLARAGVPAGKPGVVALDGAGPFVTVAEAGRVWSREAKVLAVS